MGSRVTTMEFVGSDLIKAEECPGASGTVGCDCDQRRNWRDARSVPGWA
jgi:hypothetical protein